VLRRGTEGLTDAELHRVRAQLKAGLLMGLESSFVRCEQLGGQMLTFGRVLPVDEIARGIDSVERNALDRVLARILDCQPTFAALGPLKDVESFDAIWERVR
jgi:predicted Zn-dependent peptidase